MANNPLATQRELQPLAGSLELLAANLQQHADAPLGKAHGIQLVSGYTDIYGNDLTTYQDSAGHVVGNYFVVFAVGGLLYYAPAFATALEPQDSTVDEIADAAAAPAQTQGGTSLISDYTSLEALQATNVNSLLLEHTLKPHSSAHVALTIVASPVLDSAGNTVGRQRLRFAYAGIVYEIPVDTRFGGPVQPPRGVTILNSYYDRYRHPRAVNLLVPSTIAGGSLPFTYQWQIETNLGWSNITPNPADQAVSDGSKQVNILWTSASTATFTVVSCDPGNGNSHSFNFRLVVSNSGGSATSNVFTYSVTNTSSCFITTAIMEALGEGDDCYELNLLRWYRDNHMVGSPDLEEYYRIAPHIVQAVNAEPGHKLEWRRVYEEHLLPAIAAIEHNNFDGAYLHYRGMVEELRALWLR